MQSNISYLVPDQVPEYLRDASPLFSDFMRTYYAYAEQRTSALGLTRSRFLNADVDNTLDVYLHEFYQTYGEYLPTEIALDKRNFIKLLNYIYEAKGTEKALKLVFRTIFAESIDVLYPEVLIASGGKWIQETFITLQTIYGMMPEVGDELYISDAFQQSVVVTEMTQLDSTTCRIYFKTYSKLNFTLFQLIKSYDANDDVKYIGKLVKSPSKLIIGSIGRAWQRGQVVSIPGTIKNTVARITDVNSIGAVLSVEILEHGYDHAESQTTTISPYPNKPASSATVITTTGSGPFNHAISIIDNTEGIEENIVGQTQKITGNSYFLEDYISGDYVMATVITVSNKAGTTITANVDLDLTMEEWLLSRATFTYQFDIAVKTKGYYRDDSGQISNSTIKLQDNYYYQPFSYIIESSRDIREYRQLLNITHPAGTKRFSTLVKTSDYALASSFDSSRSLSRDIVYLVDSYNVYDAAALDVSKLITNSVSVADSSARLTFAKAISETQTITETIQQKTIGKVLSEGTDAITDVLTSTTDKVLTETVNLEETLANTSAKTLTEVLTTADLLNFDSIKYIYGDAVTASHLDTFASSITTYDETDYFDENYVSLETLLSIGQ